MYGTISNSLPAGKQGEGRDPRGESRPSIYLEDLPWTDLRTIQEELTEEERKAVNRLPSGLTIKGQVVDYPLFREDGDTNATRAFWLFDRGVL